MARADVDLQPAAAPSGGADLAHQLAVSAACHHRGLPALLGWLARRRRRSPFEVVRVPFDELHGWTFEPDSGDLVHDSGRFFAVEGLWVRTDYGHRRQWWQPIINQQDSAILGILARRIDGVLHFLLQAKMEPGNINVVQFSPTVQATSSNYLRAHRGGASRYLEYFTQPGHGRVLVDILQSEQGSWFRGKRNRNIVVEVAGEVERHEDFIWLTLGEIFDLLQRPNLINMDARTVLSCLPLTAPAEPAEPAGGPAKPAGGPAEPARPAGPDDGFRAALTRSAADAGGAGLLPLAAVRSWLTGRKAAYALSVRRVALNEVVGWRRTEWDISRPDGRYFAIVGARVRATNREVRSWCQPLLAPCAPGLVAFVVRRINGVLHVLARADLRPGYRDVVELGPTVQCTQANFAEVPDGERPVFLDLVLSPRVVVRYDMAQSEEGGRFQRAVTRHLVVEVAEDFPLTAPPDFCWLTAAQLMALVGSSYQVNIEARSLLLCLLSLLPRRPAPGPVQ